MSARILAWLAAPFVLLALSGCTSVFMRAHLTEMATAYNGADPKVYVHRPAKLASVSKLVVPDFRVLFISDTAGTAVAFKDSFAEGLYWYAKDNYGIVLAEYFEEELLKAQGLEVLERNRLKRILNEQSLQMSGLADGPPIEAGQFGGADTILLGTVTQGMYYMPNEPQLPRMAMGMINVRLVDIATGDIIMIYRDRRMVTGDVIDPEGIFEAFAHRFVETLTAEKRGR